MKKIPNRYKTMIESIIVLLSGALLTLAYAPFYLWFLSFFSLIILFYLWSKSSAKRAFFYGLLFGIGNFGTGVSWIYVSIQVFGKTSIPLAVFITALFVVILSIFPAIVGLISQKLSKAKYNAHLVCFIYPCVWTLFDWIRSWIFSGFPWLFVGYTQTDTYLGGLAEVGSVYLVTYAVTLCACLILLFFRSKRITTKILSVFIILLLWALGYFFTFDQKWTIKNGPPVSVSLVQGDIEPMEKWDPLYLKQIEKTYMDLTRKYPADLIFWPENSIPIFPNYVAPYLSNLNAFAIKHNSAILFGMPLGDFNKYYNGAMVLGQGYGTYRKQHLVPFGEYFPLKSLFAPIMAWMNQPMSAFTPGGDDQGMLQMQGIDISLFICYEIAFPNLVRNDAKDAGLIVTITDDAWFGDSIGPWQHLQMAKMRAIENGKFVIQATNDGISAILTPSSEKIYPQFKRGVLQGTVYSMSGQTPWIRYGMMPLFMLIFLSLVIGLLLRNKKS